MVEYALILALIAVVAIVAVALVGTNSNSKFSSVAGAISGRNIVGHATMREALQAYCDSNPGADQSIDQYRGPDGSWLVVSRVNGNADPQAVASGYQLTENAACTQLSGPYPP